MKNSNIAQVVIIARVVRNNVGYDGENPSDRRELEQQKCVNQMPIAKNNGQY